jgi:hypothetical protein
MLANRRLTWIFIVTAAAPISLGGYRLAMQAIRSELSIGSVVGETLGVLILAMLVNWIVQLVISHRERGNGFAAGVVSMITVAIAALIYLPQGSLLITGVLLAGICQLFIATYVVTALKPKFAKAVVRKKRN